MFLRKRETKYKNRRIFLCTIVRMVCINNIPRFVHSQQGNTHTHVYVHGFMETNRWNTKVFATTGNYTRFDFSFKNRKRKKQVNHKLTMYISCTKKLLLENLSKFLSYTFVARFFVKRRKSHAEWEFQISLYINIRIIRMKVRIRLRGIGKLLQKNYKLDNF